MSLDREGLRRLAREILEREERGVRALSPLIEGEPFARAVDLLATAEGRVLVVGVGKSGNVGQRIAASFRSTGTPALFLHPVEAMHGDLGMIGPSDVGLFLSKSGASEEVLRLWPSFERVPVPVVTVTTRGDSPLARSAAQNPAAVSLVLGAIEEAGPLRAVPSTSVTVFEVLGDLLVAAVYTRRGIAEADLAWLHPGGLIGGMVSRRVADLMHSGDGLPRVGPDTPLRTAIVEMMAKKLGMTTVLDGDGRLLGVLTDGDLRRAIHAHDRIDPLRVGEVMTANPRTIDRDASVATAVERMENNHPGPITALVVTGTDGRVEGVIHLHDCLRTRRAE